MNKKITNLFKALVILIALPIYAQQGGMWIPSLLKGMNETEMKSLGMKMSVSDIYDVNKSSMKDAAPHFNGGCSSEVISPQGLLLTNHHCGYGQIQSHSSVENDYLANGFWAKSMAQELPNENLEVTFIVRIEDVTKEVMAGIKDKDTEIQKQAKISENIAKTVASFPKEKWQDNKIKSFYEGNQYIIFVTETFKDVRLVGAPPSSIGKFGSDTDNWVWPRHTGDFSLFRIYADKDNKPATYSKDNVPYRPKHFFPISLSGVEEGDFTMVFGYPGRTQEYLPSYAVEQIVNDLNPVRIGIRDKALKITDEFMRADQNIKIQYASKYASTANYWKKWIGESLGLKKTNAVQAKQDFEKGFIERAKKGKNTKAYAEILPKFEKLYKDITPYAVSRDYFTEVVQRNTELLAAAYKVYALESYASNEKSFESRRANLIKGQDKFYKNYSKAVDEKVFESIVSMYAKDAPKQFLPKELKDANISAITKDIYANSKLTSYEGFKQLLEGNADQVIKNINSDKGYVFAKALIENYMSNVLPKYEELDREIAALQRTFMKAQLELYPDARIFPDANSTLRVTYGKVDGYFPKDATYYEPVTHLEGIMEKYVPNDYEFDVPAKLVELYNNKDYGQYADNGKLPINFIATNHTTGGNSGSPVLDAHGNLIGLNFDRVWEGTMSDIYYDPSICRNIMVDARYILFIIDKFADAKHLIDEMKLVEPKKNK
ncbi:S46 family peptidase [Myroides sp. M-43]|uniref:S46 family peptidase n=1 Tax=Myroides oncorhynchi TaxID=2893756 RepID=UPI001E6502AC|nr:S46 family peptidase [Myroides oncorhynchi]MCC9042734.1 S46 family peptidase [Myroides oncorhynchi]